MILKKIEVKIYDNHYTNCYLLVDKETNEGIIIDPGGEPGKILDMVKLLEANIKYIIFTHCHFDHILAAKEIKAKTNAQILIHRFDADGLLNPETNLSYMMSDKEFTIEADARFDDADILHVGNKKFEIILTSGHTSGSTSLYFKKEKMLFTGDLMFKGTWGRTDFPSRFI